MRVLLTGDRGILGRPTRAALERDGHAVVGFDLAAGDDIRDAAAVRAAAAGCDAIVHLAGIPGDREEIPDQVMAVNVSGTWNVLLAAAAEGVRRVVHASSGKALGMLERNPRYLPIDDAHPGLPGRPYGLSKWLSEEMCEAVTRAQGIETICLRPVFVVEPPQWKEFALIPELGPARGAAWHLGVFVDARDVADAFSLAVSCEAPESGHARLLLCGDDVASDRSAVALVEEHLPDVPWRDGGPPPAGSRAALADCSEARDVLGWTPRHRWDGRGGY
ncbi:NAD(P)-dependent oxidoreductase [Conexibacter stalactiti]|uniref:NAD(P)-dependent oxidoreductase n=1 Tax=Conexibacter stalactiti TaxID=1940611 RepID=A0ABU4HUV3_9ACTN|nr:NAD(P)-dependent oxidoreductase [Conexibacter stalactiti]MDW5597093.1 NAD(P)-dependent oxidoreductase [Conexibacter stalactiti]MEC5037735.1 NAD(P)-dependent oxidoreductase [Conexibacter stalactiti]